MEFEHTQFEYLPQCSEGCGALSDWLQSRELANQAGRNHEHAEGHRWTVQERMR